MAEGKFLSIANAAGAIGGALVGGLGVLFALGDTSPKSLSGMASSLDRIAENLEKIQDIDPSSAGDAVDVLNRADQISRKVAEKAAGLELPNVDGVLLTDEGIAIPAKETKTIVMGNGERVSMSYLDRTTKGYTMTINGQEGLFPIGAHIHASEDGTCFVEFLRTEDHFSKAIVRAVCE
nr:hypothetical protein [uncultured Hyphomonas sp.]